MGYIGLQKEPEIEISGGIKPSLTRDEKNI